ncbi:hypothetical protein CN513_21135 [Bacillus cereus]|nr:hypothetical protein CN513_21135 [Bacillus cereus]PEV54226.1 hypothetical protein CN422_29150 [Bacillus cereus]PFQ51077.1 hypothetical protein COK24_19400 [Bacillus cereus]PFT53836.1 hypothetical protein COK67_30135 [Bacillus cereus]
MTVWRWENLMDELQYLPLENVTDDKLGFKEKSEDIATFINNFSANLPYSLSINGSWGAGKSTMLNFIENNLNNGKCKVVRFNPWMITDREELIKSLFEEIYYAMGEGEFHQAKKIFSKYAQKLLAPAAKAIAFVGGYKSGMPPAVVTGASMVVGETTQAVSDIIFDDKPLSVRKKELNDILNQTVRPDGQKIVIMIDEIDRLFPEEVITIFQMIKSTLDLPGLFFVVAMDEEVVFDALKKQGVSKPDYYLHKIFQRKYFINTRHQLMTLADNFLLKFLDVENNESHKALEKTLKAYFYEQAEYFAFTSSTKASDYDSSFNNEWKIDDSRPDEIIKSYYKLGKYVSDELNLHNPRTFLKFCVFVMEYWPNYYEYVFNKEKKMPCFIHTSFLILLAYFVNPSYVDVGYLTDRKLKKEDLSELIALINEHINVIIPNFKPLEKDNLYSGNLNFPNSVIRTSVIALIKSPDHLRTMRL